jgi:hypothetical protein
MFEYFRLILGAWVLHRLSAGAGKPGMVLWAARGWKWHPSGLFYCLSNSEIPNRPPPGSAIACKTGKGETTAVGLGNNAAFPLAAPSSRFY